MIIIVILCKMPVKNNRAREKADIRDTHCRIILGVGVKSVGEKRGKSFACVLWRVACFTRLRHILKTIFEFFTSKKKYARDKNIEIFPYAI